MTCKVIKTGDVWEVEVFDIPVRVGFKSSRTCYDKSSNSERRFDSLVRARSSVRQLALCNQTDYTKFLTLTYSVTKSRNT